jgi:hypothetical protein
VDSGKPRRHDVGPAPAGLQQVSVDDSRGTRTPLSLDSARAYTERSISKQLAPSNRWPENLTTHALTRNVGNVPTVKCRKRTRERRDT